MINQRNRNGTINAHKKQRTSWRINVLCWGSMHGTTHVISLQAGKRLQTNLICSSEAVISCMSFFFWLVLKCKMCCTLFVPLSTTKQISNNTVHIYTLGLTAAYIYWMSPEWKYDGFVHNSFWMQQQLRHVRWLHGLKNVLQSGNVDDAHCALMLLIS